MSHREEEKTEVYYIQSNESHGGTVGAQSTGGYLPVLFEILCLKHLFQRMSRICKLHLCHSLCHWHLPDIALFSFHSVPPCALLCGRLTLSLPVSEEQEKCPFLMETVFLLPGICRRHLRPVPPVILLDALQFLSFCDFCFVISFFYPIFASAYHDLYRISNYRR